MQTFTPEKLQRNKVLIVFVDAFGPAQLERFTEFFDFLPHRRSLHGILGYSSGALPTILTGASPAQHGRMCLFSARQDEQTSILRPLKWLGLLPKFIHERSRVRRIAEKVLANTMGLEGYVALHKVPPELFEWLDMPERDDMFNATEIGGVPTFLADARAAGLTVYAAPWQVPEEQRWEDSFLALTNDSPDLAFLYATRLDGTMHQQGPNAQAAIDAAAKIGSYIQHAQELMSEDGASLTTLVVGDHGMAEVSAFIDPQRMLSRVSNMRLFVDSTMIRAWGTDAELSELRIEIEKENWPGQWLDGDELNSRKVPAGGIFGRSMYVLDEGSIFAPSFLGGRIAGMHGYDTSCACSMAALASDCAIPDDTTGIDSIATIIRNKLDLV